MCVYISAIVLYQRLIKPHLQEWIVSLSVCNISSPIKETIVFIVKAELS